jgi:hypothetical protein
MTQEELIARAQDLVDAWNEGDVDRIVSAFCVEWRETVRLDAERLLERCPSVEIEVLRTMTAGNVVTTEWAARPRAGDQATPPRVGVTVADYDIRGRISRYSRYWASLDQPMPAQAA